MGVSNRWVRKQVKRLKRDGDRGRESKNRQVFRIDPRRKLRGKPEKRLLFREQVASQCWLDPYNYNTDAGEWRLVASSYLAERWVSSVLLKACSRAAI